VAKLTTWLWAWGSNHSCVGYAHHTCGSRPGVWTLLTVLVRLPLSICDSIHDLLGLSPHSPTRAPNNRMQTKARSWQ
jgi:hypothetical protein